MVDGIILNSEDTGYYWYELHETSSIIEVYPLQEQITDLNTHDSIVSITDEEDPSTALELYTQLYASITTTLPETPILDTPYPIDYDTTKNISFSYLQDDRGTPVTIEPMIGSELQRDFVATITFNESKSISGEIESITLSFSNDTLEVTIDIIKFIDLNIAGIVGPDTFVSFSYSFESTMTLKEKLASLTSGNIVLLTYDDFDPYYNPAHYVAGTIYVIYNPVSYQTNASIYVGTGEAWVQQS
jgi:hypothetical protein